MTLKQRLETFLRILSALLVLSASFSAAYFLMAPVYQYLGCTLPSPLAQVLNSLLGLFLYALTMIACFRLFRKRLGRRDIFSSAIEAMERLARGDFSVRIGGDLTDHETKHFGPFVSSVNNLAEELSQMEQMRQEFISNVSHEIQSPLTSIRGFAQALKQDQLGSEERAHYLSIIESESTRLSRITENLLRLATLESDHVKFEPKPYRLDKQLQELILASEPQWAGKKIELDISLEEVLITADQDLLSQVWINLLHNGIKFTPDEGTIQVELAPKEGNIEFRIKDSGPGLSEEEQPRIFERFYKADKSRTRSNGGSGLGLSIAKKIVEMHQGTIGVESKLGEGTTFTVVLPLSPA